MISNSATYCFICIIVTNMLYRIHCEHSSLSSSIKSNMNTIISTLFLSCMFFVCLMHSQTNAASKSTIINFTNLSPDNLPDEPVKLKINKTLKLRSFCVRFYVGGTAFAQSIVTNKDGLNGDKLVKLMMVASPKLS